MVVVTLALGIGANVTMFGILDRLLLRSAAHIVDADRVIQVHTSRMGRPSVQSSQPYVLYKDFLAGVSDFEDVAVTTPSNVVDRAYYRSDAAAMPLESRGRRSRRASFRCWEYGRIAGASFRKTRRARRIHSNSR
jgi:hypothetical protein